MSDLVERLAEKRHPCFKIPEDGNLDEARWWLNAIADELETHTFGFQGSDELTYTMGVHKGMSIPIAYLRSQASEAQADDQ